MRAIACTIAVLAALAIRAAAQTRIDAISTTFRWFGPNDKIIVERNDDPKVANVSCYMSRADTGGIKGGLGCRSPGRRSPQGSGSKLNIPQVWVERNARPR